MYARIGLIIWLGFSVAQAGVTPGFLGTAKDSVKSQIIDGPGTVAGPIQSISGVNYLPIIQPMDILNGSQNITTQDLATSTVAGFAGQNFIIGTPTANSAATLTLSSIQTVMVEVTGIWTGTLAIEVSSNGGTIYVPRSMHLVGTSMFVASVTANAIGSLNGAAKTQVRVRATGAVTGTVVVQFLVSDNPSNVYVANGVKLQDGSSPTSAVQGTIKSASTAPGATDTSLVVGLSPNGNQATAALQTSGNASLSSLDTDFDVALSSRSSSANQTNGTQVSQITDGTNNASVKAASTAPVFTDKALVVSERADNVGAVTQTSISCGATTTTLLAGGTATQFIDIRNPTTSSMTIWINVTNTAAVAAAPSLDIPPGGDAYFAAEGISYLPSQTINCISSGTASSVTLVYK